jgi:hypothetical protein
VNQKIHSPHTKSAQIIRFPTKKEQIIKKIEKELFIPKKTAISDTQLIYIKYKNVLDLFAS